MIIPRVVFGEESQTRPSSAERSLDLEKKTKPNEHPQKSVVNKTIPHDHPQRGVWKKIQNQMIILREVFEEKSKTEWSSSERSLEKNLKPNGHPQRRLWRKIQNQMIILRGVFKINLRLYVQIGGQFFFISPKFWLLICSKSSITYGLFTWSKVQNFLQNVQLQKFCKKSAKILQIFLQNFCNFFATFLQLFCNFFANFLQFFCDFFANFLQNILRKYFAQKICKIFAN